MRSIITFAIQHTRIKKKEKRKFLLFFNLFFFYYLSIDIKWYNNEHNTRDYIYPDYYSRKKTPNNILEYSGPDKYNILLFPMHFMAIE